jgi:hypothetical protein
MTSLLSRSPGTRHESSVQYPATRPKSLAGSARGSLGFHLKPGPTIPSMFVGSQQSIRPHELFDGYHFADGGALFYGWLGPMAATLVTRELGVHR